MRSHPLLAKDKKLFVVLIFVAADLSVKTTKFSHYTITVVTVCPYYWQPLYFQCSDYHDRLGPPFLQYSVMQSESTCRQQCFIV